MTKVLIADDHPIVVSGIRMILQDSGYDIVATVGSGEAALDALASARPDILVLDVQMPGRSGMDVLRTLRSRGDIRPIILLTADIGDSNLLNAIKLGVNGIVLKDGAQNLLVRCLDQVRDGGRWIDKDLLQRALDLSMTGGGNDRLKVLTDRERAIGGLVAQGLRNREIASELGIGEGTVKVYLHRIYEKLGVGSRTELAIMVKDAEQA